MPPELLDYQIGKYGGTMRFVTQGTDWDADVFILCTEPLLNSPGLLAKEITGNVLRGYTVSDDQKEFTFYMREGLKWSDGVPVTMEDVRFTVEDFIFNSDLNVVIPAKWRSGGTIDGTPMKFSIVDDWTFKLTFDQPYGGFLLVLSIQSWAGYTDLMKPAHFLKPYHVKYATDADKAKWPALFKEYGYFENDPLAWVNLFNKIDITNWDLCQKVGIGFPKLYPWLLTSATDSLYTYERNPYYFKIDSSGQQLPYVDKIESYKVENMEMVQLKMISGEVDLARESATMANIQLYKQNENKGYTIYMHNMHVTPADVGINMTWADGDAEYISIVRNLKFRQALDKAVDKDELIDTLYYGFAEPSDLTDPVQDKPGAEALLREIGMTKGSDGYYRTPSGKPFEILFEAAADNADIIPYTELVAEMWKAIGIKTTVKRVEQTFRDNKQNANQLQARTVWTASPAMWFYNDWGMFMWGRAWEINYAGTTQVDIKNDDGTTRKQSVLGETPPPLVDEFYKMNASLFAGSLSDANATYAKLRRHLRDNLWYFSFIMNVKQPLLLNSRLRNVAASGGYALSVDYSGEILWYDN